VWEALGWAQFSVTAEAGKTNTDLSDEANRIVSLLKRLPEETISRAIGGIAHLFSSWEKEIAHSVSGVEVWLKLWPIAVQATNTLETADEGSDQGTVAKPSHDAEPRSLDTLNSPAGKLVAFFLVACPNLTTDPHPFKPGTALTKMRDTVADAPGQAGLISRHRLLESLDYFYRAAPDWTQTKLLAALFKDNSDALALWRAIGRRILFRPVLELIGEQMAERAADERLGRETQRTLIASLVVECLYALLEERDPAVAYVRVQQTLRSVNDEVRASGAVAIQRFVRDVSAPNLNNPEPASAERLFETAVAPFLERVWPQERSLATPGVSRALADLPSATRGSFAGAVESIARFMVPFECWSMIDFGLYGEEGGMPKLSMINSPDKAAALLRLLDLAVGTVEGSVIPSDLAEALEQVRKIAPALENDRVFRRLSTAARRV